jgi:hypothetical protein
MYWTEYTLGVIVAAASLGAAGAGGGPRSPVETVPSSRPPGIPNDWVVSDTAKGGGIKYVDPGNVGNSVRVMPGNPNSPYPSSQGPYVRWQVNGKPLDANGNILPTSKTSDAHVPLDKFNFDLGVFEP